MTIDLIESIIGFEREIKFLDNKKILLKFLSGDSIGDGDVKMIRGLGMPSIRGNPGDLIIKFKVRTKNIEEWSDNEKALLSKIFKHSPKEYNNKKVYNIENYNQNESNQSRGPQVRVDGPGDCSQQ